MSPTAQKQPALSNEQALVLWRRFKATQDRAIRDQLVLSYAPMVRYLVFKKVRHLPAQCDAEDLISCGLLALIGAIDRYDPERGAGLAQFAWTRIQGAIVDELRRQDWAPRPVRRAQRDMERAETAFIAEHARRPTDPELADALGCTVTQLSDRRHEAAAAETLSLNDAVVLATGESGVERVETIPSDADEFDPLSQALRGAERELLAAAIDRLPERERTVITLIYQHGRSLASIGELLGVTESRVCQLHGAGKRRLRTLLEGPELAAA
jgi:RNA polymerase sigma factor for flagellar operon FliA